MDWIKVALTLEDEALRLRRDAPAAFPGDFVTQREMLTRAAIFDTFATALRRGAGLRD